MNYSELNVPEQIHKAVERMGFTEMTEVQEKAIPPYDGRASDIIAKAPTGTGKTCAFGIPLILGLDQSRNYPQAVVMAPTRELAQQITEDLQRPGAFLSGHPRRSPSMAARILQKQIEQLKKGAQIVVATPGRLQDHMNRRTVDLSHVYHRGAGRGRRDAQHGLLQGCAQNSGRQSSPASVWQCSAPPSAAR